MRKEKGNGLINILNRVKWPISIGVVAFIISLMGLPSNTLKLLLYKIQLITLAVVFSHYIRKEIFPYIDLEVLLREDKKTELPDAIKFAGAAILIGVMTYAIILGLTAGL